MALKDITDPNAVAQAIAQFDELGREAFLKQYGYGRARRFFVDHNGQLYDSKALLGVAHKFQFPEEGPLDWTDFPGGETTTVKKLQDLGFKVVPVAVDSDQSADLGLPISELLPEVFELQHTWSPQTHRRCSGAESSYANSFPGHFSL